MTKIRIVQSPDGLIPVYPKKTEQEEGEYDSPYPRTWENDAYADAVSFEAEVDEAPTNKFLHFKWKIIANPGNWEFRLREVIRVPPGEPLVTSTFYKDKSEVWLPFQTRYFLDNGRSGHEFTDYSIECQLKLTDEDDREAEGEIITANLPLTLETSIRSVYEMSLPEKIEQAIIASIPHWDPSLAATAHDYFTDPHALGLLIGTILIFIGFAAFTSPLSLLLGKIFADVLTIYFGITTIHLLTEVFTNLYRRSQAARTRKNIEEAGFLFAKESSKLVFDLIAALVFWRLGRATSDVLTHVRSARSKFLNQLVTEENRIGGVSAYHREPEAMEIITNCKQLVRKMPLSEWFAHNYTHRGFFPKGVEANKAFRTNVIYTFQRELELKSAKDILMGKASMEDIKKVLNHLKDYAMVHTIRVNESMLDLLKYSINNRRIPEGINKDIFPRYKWEDSSTPRRQEVTILIPEEIYSEFDLHYTSVKFAIYPIDEIGPPTEDTDGFLTFSLEDEE